MFTILKVYTYILKVNVSFGGNPYHSRQLKKISQISELQEKQRESYATQICAGMKYLSQKKCVHRNLRLEHVYMMNYNDVVITNFGLARVTEALYYQQKRIMASDTFVIYPPEVREAVSGPGGTINQGTVLIVVLWCRVGRLC